MDVKDIALSGETILHQKYQIQEVYYWGHTGIIYMATDLDNHTKIAIKEYCPYRLSNRDIGGKNVVCKGNAYRALFLQGLDNFSRECKIVQQVSNIDTPYDKCTLQYLDSFEENDTRYLVTEYIEGMNLKEYIENGNEYSVSECMGYLLKTIEQIHEKGIIHRDVKPANIIIRKDGKPVLIDFGSACYTTDENCIAQFVSNGYSAPELYQGGTSDMRTDVYSIGALTYYMLTGCRLPPADEITIDEPIPPVSEYADVTDILEKAVMKAIEPDLNKRASDTKMIESALNAENCKK